MMDDPDCDPAMLRKALEEISFLNRYLGAHRIYKSEFLPQLLKNPEHSLSVLDVGTGIGDIPIRLLEWTSAANRSVHIMATDIRADVLETAAAYADEHLEASLRPSIDFETADMLDLHYQDSQFDYVIAGQALHHFDASEIPLVLSEMKRVARIGVFIEDLHRHVIPYVFVSLATRALRFTPMVRQDGPISVRRGFRRNELNDHLSELAGSVERIKWHPTFRWSVYSGE